jgi:glutathione synthase/RimK-type ligase-like ATP-grasp enzyme
VGVDLLPTANGFLVLELNGAVDFRPVYLETGDVFSDAVAALLGEAARQPELAAAL